MMRSWIQLCLLAAMLVVMLPGTQAQIAAPPKHEFRAAWIATVYGLDWPQPRAGESQQKGALRQLLDHLQSAGINSVIFQVRSIGDAMYESNYEPWSHYLTGTQGMDPGYDPLAFVIEESHNRGMELHAWFNPYRADNGSSFKPADNHVTVTHPEWTYKAGPLTLLDPGKEEVRNYVVSIIMDVARRYNIDGVHFDDYFYPYPPNQITTQDSQTFQTESRGFMSLFDWRRDNVNLLIAQVADSLRSFDSTIKFGISPFGIWKNNVPAGIRGLDAYSAIYADATAWIRQKTIDYLAPQLYWPFGGAQAYEKLAPWWADQIDDRHLYPGHALYRTEAFSPISPMEIPNQVAFNRDYFGIQGSIFFRALHILPSRGGNFARIMRDGLYQYPALTPSMDWKDQIAPAAPLNLVASQDGGTVRLTWDPPSEAPARYAVYRVRSELEPDATTAAQDARNLIAITGRTTVTTTVTDSPSADAGRHWYFVQSVSSNSIESGPSNVVLSPIQTGLDSELARPGLSMVIYPTVFRQQAQIEYTLEEPGTVTLQLVDVIGRSSVTLIDGEYKQPGQHALTITASEHALASGLYWLVLRKNNQQITRAVTLVR